MRAILFPGQGSQYVGMGSIFYEKYDLVKEIFNTVDETLNYPLSKIILKGPEEELKLTKNTQPAIMALGVSIFKIMNEKFNMKLNSSKFFAGHSLGEYTALVCAGSLTIKDAAYLLHERGKAMQNSVPKVEGAMTAIIGLDISEVKKELLEIKKIGVCEIANDNSNEQVDGTGEKKAIDELNKVVKKKNKRGIILPVSAPFHCSLMKNALDNMKDKIDKTDFSKPDPNIISNVTAVEENDIYKIKNLLVSQITATVRWRESVNYMINKGVKEFLEIGPGKVLSGLVRKIDKDVKVMNINSIDDINDCVKND